MELPESMEVH